MDNVNVIKNDILKEETYLKVLDNGLRVYFMPKKGYTKKYAVFSTNYGSNDNKFVPIGEENPTKVPEGIAHFLEHKLFEEKKGNIFNEFSKLGSYVNAYTNFNQTAYLFSCTDKFYDNLELLVSFVQSPYFTDENVNKEKGIIAQEIKMYQDNPSWKVFFNCLRGMYVNHPVRNDIAGTVESISEIDKETLYKCYRTFYHPSNMILFIVGDLNFEKTIDVINKSLKRDIKKFEGEIDRRFDNEPNHINQKHMEENLSVSTPLFNIGFKDLDVGYDGKKLLKKQIMTNILLNMLLGPSSEFHQKLYEKGLINSSFGAQYVSHKTYGHSIMGGESKSPEKVLKEVLSYIDEVKSNGLNPNDFERTKNKMIGKHIMNFDSLEYISNSFLKYAFNNTSLLDYLTILKDIKLEDVIKRFDSHFTKENYCLSVIKPD